MPPPECGHTPPLLLGVTRTHTYSSDALVVLLIYTFLIPSQPPAHLLLPSGEWIFGVGPVDRHVKEERKEAVLDASSPALFSSSPLDQGRSQRTVQSVAWG